MYAHGQIRAFVSLKNQPVQHALVSVSSYTQYVLILTKVRAQATYISGSVYSAHLRIFASVAPMTVVSSLLSEGQTAANRSFPTVIPTIHLPVLTPTPHRGDRTRITPHIPRYTSRSGMCQRDCTQPVIVSYTFLPHYEVRSGTHVRVD